ncbi:hypothetical protein LJC55_00900 [Eubacteriales bacterium OttesenSCG-928-N14]|nr:hypothetical protein [Eubacteriales bacterium OttesenSCG-928-N14]
MTYTILLLAVVVASLVSYGLYFNSYGRLADKAAKARKYFEDKSEQHKPKDEEA